MRRKLNNGLLCWIGWGIEALCFADVSHINMWGRVFFVGIACFMARQAWWSANKWGMWLN